MPQPRLIHIHAAGGTWHLSAGQLVMVNLYVNVEHMQTGQGDYAQADETPISEGVTCNKTTQNS